MRYLSQYLDVLAGAAERLDLWDFWLTVDVRDRGLQFGVGVVQWILQFDVPKSGESSIGIPNVGSIERIAQH